MEHPSLGKDWPQLSQESLYTEAAPTLLLLYGRRELLPECKAKQAGPLGAQVQMHCTEQLCSWGFKGLGVTENVAFEKMHLLGTSEHFRSHFGVHYLGISEELHAQQT